MTQNYFKHIRLCASLEPTFSTRLAHLIEGIFLRFRKLHFVEMIVTTKCNLRCINCSNLISELQHKAEDIPLEIFKRDLDILMSNFKYIYCLQIHGGEPLLHPEIDQILAYALEYRHKIRVVKIVTNGTVLPSQKLLHVISRQNVIIGASCYKINEGLREKLRTICATNNVFFTLFEDKQWFVFKKPEKETYSIRELKSKFHTCPANMYPSYKNGKLYLCSRLANLVTLKDDIADDGIELSPSSRKGAIRFLQKDYSVNCKYCQIDENNFCEAAMQHNLK
jgi:organic radical activating enzyme